MKTIGVYLVPESTSPVPLGPAFHSLAATEENKQLLGIGPKRRIDCPLDQVPALWFEPAGSPDPDLDGLRDPRYVLARLEAAALGLSAGWYHTRLSVEQARTLKKAA